MRLPAYGVNYSPELTGVGNMINPGRSDRFYACGV